VAETVVGRDGRAKAYRPLPAEERAAAFEAGLAAYDRGDYFEAHELLEPAWMGTDDLAERALLQGLIKLAAAYVHSVRGNPAGISRNLEGARSRLEEAHEDGRHSAGLEVGVNRTVIGPDGAIYVGGTGEGGNWGEDNKLRYGLQKLTPNGKNVFDMEKMETPVCWMAQFRDPDGNKLVVHKRK